jgi:hypothetical protein
MKKAEKIIELSDYGKHILKNLEIDTEKAKNIFKDYKSDKLKNLIKDL